MKTIDFCHAYKPCKKGKDFALQFETMEEVWEKCEHPDWMFWILKKYKPLNIEQGIKLTVLFCRPILNLIPKTSYEKLNEAEKYLGLELSVFDATSADADAAAYAAYTTASASYAAYVATTHATASYVIKKRLKLCEIIRNEIPNPFK